MERFVVSIITWVALWGELSVANLVTGLVVSLVLWRAFPSSERLNHRIHLLGAVRFLGKFFIDLVTSSFTVALTVLRPTEERLTVQVVDVRLHTTDSLLLTVVCNAMTLTPGTMTVSVDEETSMMKLHVLGNMDAEEVRRHVHELEARVMDAIRTRSRKRHAL